MEWILPDIVVWSSFLSLPLVIWGAVTYTRQHSPFPTVAAMVIHLIFQLVARGVQVIRDIH